MPKQKVLITVTTYPLPSRSYDELVCTAGVLENGQWIRIYPVPLSFLTGMKTDQKVQQFKYTWIELDLKKRTDDFRPESHSPQNYNFQDLTVHGTISTERNWLERKQYCLANVYTNLSQLIGDSKAPKNVSLATFKPTKIKRFEWVEDTKEWKDEWKDLRKQGDLFAQDSDPEKIIPKLPYKFYYVFTDDAGKESRMMIEDWEIGALYWNCLKGAEGDEAVALKKVKEKYEQFAGENDTYLFLGTTMKFHRQRAKNPFVIIGVFYPKKEVQASLF